MGIQNKRPVVPVSSGTNRRSNVLEPTFTADLDRYLEWLSRPGLAQGDPCSQASIVERRAHLRGAATTLARVRGDQTRVTSLAELVAPANANLILSAYLQPTAQRRAIYRVHRLLLTLIRVATDWVHLPEDQLDQLIGFQQTLRRGWPIRPGLNAKHRRLLQRLDDPTMRSRLFALPQALATAAREQQLPVSAAARLERMQMAIAIELLLLTAMTLAQLVSLRVRAHLSWVEPDGVLTIRLPKRPTRRDPGREYELGGESSALIREYNEQFLPRMGRGEDPWLFCRLDGRPIPGATLAMKIKQVLKRELDLDMTAHQFRHLFARLTLEAHPGAYGMVKDLLGHHFLQTTLWMYAQPERRDAGRQWNECLDLQLTQLANQGK